MRRIVDAAPPVALVLLCLADGAACQTRTPAPPADVVILFVGNSLTYANDLPALVRRVAAGTGVDVRTHLIAHPDFSLEDHWGLGIADSIGRIRPDFVVMQQGPSSLPESRAHLVAWTDSLARATHAAGGEPLVYMVWPPRERAFAWDAVRDSYTAAAIAAGARLVPAGEAIRARLEMDPSAPLLAGDGFHPAHAGSLLVATTIVEALFGTAAGSE